MYKRLLIAARDFPTAQHWAKNHQMSPGQWVYISSYHNIQGNAGSEYIKLPGFESRPDAALLEAKFVEHGCPEYQAA